jgi:hypothetical protein
MACRRDERFVENGPIFTVPLIERERQSISGSAPSAMSLLPRPSLRRRSTAKGWFRIPLRWMATQHLTRGARNGGRRVAARGYNAEIIEVLQQPDRTRPSKCQVQRQCDAWLQPLSEYGRYDIRHRTDTSHSESPVRSLQDATQRYHAISCLDDGVLSSLKWRTKDGVSPARSICTTTHVSAL